MTVCSPSAVSGWRSCWPSDRSVIFALAIPLAAYFPSAGWHGGASPSGRCIAIRLPPNRAVLSRQMLGIPRSY